VGEVKEEEGGGVRFGYNPWGRVGGIWYCGGGRTRCGARRRESHGESRSWSEVVEMLREQSAGKHQLGNIIMKEGGHAAALGSVWISCPCGSKVIDGAVSVFINLYKVILSQNCGLLYEGSILIHNYLDIIP
jgi:hypothetical protein